MDVPDSWSEYLWALALTTGAISADIYYNTTVTLKDGTAVPLSKILRNIFSSPNWEETEEMVKQFRNHKRDYLQEALLQQMEANVYEVAAILNLWLLWPFFLCSTDF